jgi:hypothetical protein
MIKEEVWLIIEECGRNAAAVSKANVQKILKKILY